MERLSSADIENARRLCALTNSFYRAQASSFSDTRRDPWPGWRRCLDAAGLAAGESPEAGDPQRVGEPQRAGDPQRTSGDPLRVGNPQRASGEPGARIDSHGAAGPRPLVVLDLGCGNLRFERFLCDALPEAPFVFHAVDACDELAALAEHALPADRAHVLYQGFDACAALAEGRSLAGALEVADRSCDLAVAFGFMHHVPLAVWRAEVLRALVRKVRPGGFVAASFWRFMESPKLARKAVRETARAASELPGALPHLCEGDHLLGWQGKPGAFRYCHHFSDDEIDALVRSVAPAANPIAAFRADGAPGNLNSYVVLRVETAPSGSSTNLGKMNN